jgi:hypothetical protein
MSHRREFVSTVTASVLLATLPGLANANNAQQPAQLRQPQPVKLGPGGAILDVPENKPLLQRIDGTRELTPEELLKLAGMYRDNASTASLAHHLAGSAMAMLATSPSINRAMATVAKTQIEWSILGDAWNAVKDFFTGGTGQKDPAHCKYKCLGTVVYSVLIEKCGSRDSWHLIGLCSGFKW